MEDDLFNVASRVQDERSFLEFLDALAADRQDEVNKEKAKPAFRYGRGGKNWENGTIEAFLDAASAWGKATATRNVAGNAWQRCAQILSAGKFYE